MSGRERETERERERETERERERETEGGDWRYFGNCNFNISVSLFCPGMLTITDFINILRRYYKSPIVSVTIYCTVSLESLDWFEEVFLFSRIFFR